MASKPERPPEYYVKQREYRKIRKEAGLDIKPDGYYRTDEYRAYLREYRRERKEKSNILVNINDARVGQLVLPGIGATYRDVDADKNYVQGVLPGMNDIGGISIYVPLDRPDKVSRYQNDTYRSKRRNRYRQNRDSELVTNRLRVSQMREYVTSLKRDRVCPHCGESRPECLQWHHRNPDDKAFTISNGYGASMDKMLAEIAKCDLMCANCHIHYHLTTERDIDNS